MQFEADPQLTQVKRLNYLEMNQFTRIIAAFCCISICIFSETFAQNLALSTQNPPGLYVCGIDQVSVTVQNTNGSPAATSVQLVAILPLGVTYEPGTVTGATEFNISNLSSPVFAMADLPGGATNTVRFSIKAGCSLVGDINNGQVFSQKPIGHNPANHRHQVGEGDVRPGDLGGFVGAVTQVKG